MDFDVAQAAPDKLEERIVLGPTQHIDF